MSGLDDKIELNRQTNETLEALARALFKDWFVDFGPTRTKAEGGAPYLAPELWALFPDALDDEDKPVGWEKKELGDLVSLTKGRSYKSSELRDSATALVTLIVIRKILYSSRHVARIAALWDFPWKDNPFTSTGYRPCRDRSSRHRPEGCWR